ncbi:MAG: hypothetical protein ACRCXZ_05100 [Patescibacteria group bacterium]
MENFVQSLEILLDQWEGMNFKDNFTFFLEEYRSLCEQFDTRFCSDEACNLYRSI